MKNGLIINKVGNKFWYKNNLLHREDGPAIEYADGSKEWYIEDKLHRVDGPAVEHLDGSEEWYFEDKLHRVDGPALKYADGKKYWYYYGEEIECRSQKKFEKLIKLKVFW